MPYPLDWLFRARPLESPWFDRGKEKSGVEWPFTRITLTASNDLSWDVHKLRSAAHDKLTIPSVGVKA